MKTAVVTISDGCFAGMKEDVSGQILADVCREQGWEARVRRTVPDEVSAIQKELSQLVEEDLDLVLTTGGTGLGPRDMTPEAVGPLLEKSIPGLAELMRQKGLEKTLFAAISRSLAGSIGATLVLCLPGSPKGAADSFLAVLPLIPHLHDLLNGRTKHGGES